MPVLPDVLDHGLAVVFVGTAASRQSLAKRAPYAGPGNRFWPILHEAGLIPVSIAPTEYRTVLKYGIGLTNMAPDSVGNDDVLEADDFDPDGVRAKIEHFQPQVLAFVGKRAAQEFLGRKSVPYGPLSDRVGTTTLWVLPSTSGAARRYWDPGIWHALAAAIRAK